MQQSNMTVVGSVLGLGILGSYLMLSGTFEKEHKPETRTAQPSVEEAAPPPAVDPHAQVDPHGGFGFNPHGNNPEVLKALAAVTNGENNAENNALAAAAAVANGEGDSPAVTGAAGRGAVKADDGAAAAASLSPEQPGSPDDGAAAHGAITPHAPVYK